MRFFLFIIITFFVCSCTMVQSPNLKSIKDTLICYNYYNYNVSNYHWPISKMLDNNYLALSFTDCTADIVCEIHNDTTFYASLLDSISCNKFVECFINKYYNHYPLSDKEYDIIKKVIIIAYFGLKQEGKYSYRYLKEYYKFKHVVNNFCIRDSTKKIYHIGLYDTIHKIQSNIELLYIDHYQLYVDNFPKMIIYQQDVNDSITYFSINK